MIRFRKTLERSIENRYSFSSSSSRPLYSQSSPARKLVEYNHCTWLWTLTPLMNCCERELVMPITVIIFRMSIVRNQALRSEG